MYLRVYQKTAYIFLNIINYLFFIMEAHSVYSESEYKLLSLVWGEWSLFPYFKGVIPILGCLYRALRYN
jgi:hypothetical protein